MDLGRPNLGEVAQSLGGLSQVQIWQNCRERRLGCMDETMEKGPLPPSLVPLADVLFVILYLRSSIGSREELETGFGTPLSVSQYYFFCAGTCVNRESNTGIFATSPITVDKDDDIRTPP
jgi:hypothetical protein